jgi:hypothetical protein
MNTNILKKLNSLFRLEKDILSQVSEITSIIFNLIIEKMKIITIVKP